MMIRRRRRTQLTIPEISLTPLIDTALTLLIIFMIATPMMKTTIKVDLPESSSMEKTQSHPESIEVVIDAQRQLFVNNTPMSASQVQRYIEAHIGSVPDRAVFLSGDKSVQFQEIVRVFDIIKAIAGVQHVALLTTKVE